MDVDHRHEQRVPGDPGVAGRGLADPVLRHDPDVGGGTTDVERDEALASRRLTGPLPAEQARCRPGKEECHRLLGGGLDRGDAAVRHHHVQLPGHAFAREGTSESLEIAARRRVHEGVHARRREALELAELREDVGARRDEGAGHLLRHDLGGPPLMLGIEVGEEEADGDRLDAGVLQRTCRRPHLVLVQRLQDLSGRWDDSLARDVAVPALHERPRLPRNVLHDRVVLGALVAADVHDVAKTLRRHHAGLCAVDARAPRSSRRSSRGRRPPRPTARPRRRCRARPGRRPSPDRDRLAWSGPCARAPLPTPCRRA